MATSDYEDDSNFHINKLLNRPSAFPGESGSLMHPFQQFDGKKFEPGPRILNRLAECHVLVVGAGGLGCELLKNLALCGFKKLSVVDADIIDITNLNRQFLFRMKDVGSSKSKVACEFIRNSCAGMDLKTYNCFIQKLSDESSPHYQQDFYQQFDLVICGLDNLEARTWMSDTLVKQVQPMLTDEGRGVTLDSSSVTPMIDGGTEGFNGQIHVTIPWVNLDFGNRTWMFPKRQEVPLCTIASNPRKPEHCVAYAMVMAWPEMAKKKVASGEWKTDRPYDSDSPDDIKWLTLVSMERAKNYKIAGPLAGDYDAAYFYTMGVVKSIIPAIASTNAMISAMCVQEAFKLVSYCSRVCDNFALLMGTEGMEMQYQSLTKDNFRAALPLESIVPFPKDEKDTTVRELMDGITHSDSYYMMSMKYGSFKFNTSDLPAAGEIKVYTYRFLQRDDGTYIKTYDKVKKRYAVVSGPGDTITISVADLEAAGGTAGAFKQLIAAAAKAAGESWFDHFYVGNMKKDLLRKPYDVKPPLGNRFISIPGMRDVEVVSPWIGLQSSLSDEQLARTIDTFDLEDQDYLQVFSEFMINQRKLEIVIYTDYDVETMDRIEESSGSDEGET